MGKVRWEQFFPFSMLSPKRQLARDQKTAQKAQKTDMSVDVTTTYDFATGNTKVTVMASFDPRKEDLASQKELRETMMSELLGEVSLMHEEVDVTERDIRWERSETTNGLSGEVEAVTITATIDLEDS